ncbi:MAG TPA: carboxypeptidase regulatory-like domain-containing protein, partial [Vicinamibacterales bacterium]
MKCLGVLAIPLVILLAGAGPAFAQGGQGNGTLVGTVVDNVGVIPGATVTATHVATNTSRTGTTNEQGEFRLVSLSPGRYLVKVEMDGFRPVTIAEFSLLGGEIRPLGRITMTAGGVTESVTITAEVTPVQTANSALSKNITGDTLVSVQVKGRDVFGMMKILPGVMDSHASRDYAQWNSGRYLSINGGDSLNKNTTIDGVPVGEEGGSGTTYVTPNIDSIGEVNVITSGYNAEHGRQSSGLVQITTKSGTNQLRGSAWTNLRRDEWNKNDFFRIQSKSPKPFFEVNIGGYSIGGPIVIPKVVDSRTSTNKFYFFASQEFTEDIRPTNITRSNLPTELERNGDFSQTYFGKATLNADGSITGPGAGQVQIIRDPQTGQPFPGNVIPKERFNPMGQAMLYLAPLPNNVRNPTTNEYNNSNTALDLTPRHSRTNFITRVDAVFGPNTRASVRALFDRDDAISPNNIAPGVGEINNNFPGNLLNGTMTKVLSPSMVNETIFGYSWNHWGHRVGTGSYNSSDYTQWWQENVRNPVTGQLGLFPPRIEPFGEYGEPVQKNDNKDEWPYLPRMAYGGGDRGGLFTMTPSGSSGPLPKWNRNLRTTIKNDLSYTRGRHNYKFGLEWERDSKTEPGSQDYTGEYTFGHNADNPLSTGNGYANALLGIVSTYNERNERIDRDERHWY